MSLSLGDEICTYLQGQGLGLNFNQAGTINLFSSLLPDSPDFAAAVIERGGLPPIMVLTGGGGPESKLDQPVVQIRARSGMQGYLVGNTMVEGIFKALQGVVETTLNPGGATFHLIRAQQSPVYLGRDDRQRHEWSQNYFIMWENDQR
jgi:hypothetical protein